MKLFKPLTIFSVCLPVVCFAAKPDKGKRPVHNEAGSPAELFKQFDKNKDRKLDEEERAALQKTYAVLSKLDRNHDGEIDHSEVTPTQSADGARRHDRSQAIELLKQADKNGNRSIDPEELDGLQEMLKKSGAPILAKLDQNGNGKLEADEVKRLNDRMGQRKSSASSVSTFKSPPEKPKLPTEETIKPADAASTSVKAKEATPEEKFKDKTLPNNFGK